MINFFQKINFILIYINIYIFTTKKEKRFAVITINIDYFILKLKNSLKELK